MVLHPETRWLGQSCTWLERVDSTNTWMKDRWQELPHGAAVSAGAQFAGRGRMGRTWEDAPGQMLILSFLLRQDLTPERLGMIPLIAALAGSLAIEELTGGDCGIKWPNDLLLGDKKIAGILCESRCDARTLWAVCGMGVNLTQDRDYFESRGLPHGSSILLSTGRTVDRDRLGEQVLERFEELWERFLAEGFAPLLPLYESRCRTIGKQVRICRRGTEQTALCLGLGEDGTLLCRDGAGSTFSVSSGEVSVRGLYGYI